MPPFSLQMADAAFQTGFNRFYDRRLAAQLRRIASTHKEVLRYTWGSGRPPPAFSMYLFQTEDCVSLLRASRRPEKKSSGGAVAVKPWGCPPRAPVDPPPRS